MDLLWNLVNRSGWMIKLTDRARLLLDHMAAHVTAAVLLTQTDFLPLFIDLQVMNGIMQSTGWPLVLASFVNWFGKSKWVLHNVQQGVVSLILLILLWWRRWHIKVLIKVELQAHFISHSSRKFTCTKWNRLEADAQKSTFTYERR